MRARARACIYADEFSAVSSAAYIGLWPNEKRYANKSEVTHTTTANNREKREERAMNKNENAYIDSLLNVAWTNNCDMYNTYKHQLENNQK